MSKDNLQPRQAGDLVTSQQRVCRDARMVPYASDTAALYESAGISEQAYRKGRKLHICNSLGRANGIACENWKSLSCRACVPDIQLHQMKNAEHVDSHKLPVRPRLIEARRSKK